MSREDFYEAFDAFDNCMLMTFGDDGRPHARPMAIAGRDASVVSFVSPRDSGKVDEAREDRTAVITAQDSSRWVAATGTASIVEDRARLDELWSPVMDAWFPDGPDTPGVVILDVHLHDGEYWDVSGGSLVQFAAGVAESLVTGEQIDDDAEGDQGRVQL